MAEGEDVVEMIDAMARDAARALGALPAAQRRMLECCLESACLLARWVRSLEAEKAGLEARLVALDPASPEG